MCLRTDLAIEAKRIWDRDTHEKTKLSGVEAYRENIHGLPVDVVKILDLEGMQSLGKPVGSYLTLELPESFHSDRIMFEHLTDVLARLLCELLADYKSPMVVGLGNREITPDSIGPKTLEHLLITRHLKPSPFFGDLCSVEPGVLAATGLESLSLVRGAVREAKPDCVIVVDALASCEADRLCRSIQLTDAGIVPGSGVGNCREGFDRDALGVPVVAIGVPTVTDHGDSMGINRRLILSAADIDLRVRNISKLIGYGINLFAHPKLSKEDLPWLLS